MVRGSIPPRGSPSGESSRSPPGGQEKCLNNVRIFFGVPSSRSSPADRPCRALLPGAIGSFGGRNTRRAAPAGDPTGIARPSSGLGEEDIPSGTCKAAARETLRKTRSLTVAARKSHPSPSALRGRNDRSAQRKGDLWYADNLSGSLPRGDVCAPGDPGSRLVKTIGGREAG